MRIEQNKPNRALKTLILVVLSFLPAWGQTTSQPAKSKPQTTPATAHAGAANQPNSADSDKFLIGNDDVLAINVWKEPEISRPERVRSDGKSSLPLFAE